MTNVHATTCNIQALHSHHEGPELRSLHAMPPKPHLGASIEAETTTPDPFSRATPAAVKFPSSNTDVSTSHACHTEQTSLEAVTTVTSQDLNTDTQPCVNSGCERDDSHLNKTLMKHIGNMMGNGRITSQNGTSKHLPQLLQTHKAGWP